VPAGASVENGLDGTWNDKLPTCAIGGDHFGPAIAKITVVDCLRWGKYTAPT